VKLRNKVSRWWVNAHQRGIFMHCSGMFWPCFIANIACVVLRRDLTWADWPARWHDKAGYRVGMRSAESEQERAEWLAEATEWVARRDERVARARRIRELGWGR
jgi:hypothetical protein